MKHTFVYKTEFSALHLCLFTLNVLDLLFVLKMFLSILVMLFCIRNQKIELKQK